MITDQYLNNNESKIFVCYSLWEDENLLNSSKNFYIENKNKFFFYKYINTKIIEKDNIFQINLDNYFSKFGNNEIFDNRNYYLFKSRLSLNGIEKLRNLIDNIIISHETKKKKILVLDCDNTLWGGILGEDGKDKILIGGDGNGKIYSDFQKNIIELYNKGVLIAISSKNNESDVKDIFENHSEMKLKTKHIINFKVNWDNKYENIIKMSKELDLHISNFAFFDDNKIERDQIKINLPEVMVIEPPNNIYDWPVFIKNLNIFSKSNIIENDKKRNVQYKLRHKFIDDKQKIKDEIDFLKKIQLKPKLVKINESNIARAIQLIERTNQFNLIANRYNTKEIQKAILKKEIIYLLNLKDSYGDHGLVGLVHLTELEKKNFMLKNFLLSCRILGRHVENWLLFKIKEKLCKLKFKKLIIKPNFTGKNQVAINFLTSLELRKDMKEEIYFLEKKNKYKIYRNF